MARLVVETRFLFGMWLVGPVGSLLILVSSPSTSVVRWLNTVRRLIVTTFVL